MNDRPNLSELIDAARGHLESQVIPAIKGDAKLYFQTLVAINVLKIAEREIALHYPHLRAEWERLNTLMGSVDALPVDPIQADATLAARVQLLCGAIRAGEYDDDQRRAALFDHLIHTARESLAIDNPKFLQTLDAE